MSFNWTPGIGDPTVVGWLTVALYVAAAISVWRTGRVLYDQDIRERRAWIGIGILFGLLGINKQLDLQSAFTELGRMLATYQGWYGERQSVQLAFIVAITVACIIAGLVIAILLRSSSVPLRIASLGTAFVMGYVLIRAASFHHIDRFIGQTVLGLRWNWILEVGGISLVLAASEWRRRIY